MAERRVADAIEVLRPMLDPLQQKLEDEVERPLFGAIEAFDRGAINSAQVQIKVALDAATRLNYT